MKVMPDLVRQKEKGRADRAVIYINGKKYHCGKWGSPESVEKANRLLAEWLANGQKPVVKKDDVVTVQMLVDAYLDYAEERFTYKSGVFLGQSTGNKEYYETITKLLVELYGGTIVGDFDTLSLIALREKMKQKGIVRTSINTRISKIRGIFKWGVSRNLIDISQYNQLMTLEMLEKNHIGTLESSPVLQAEYDWVIKTIAVAHKMLGDMIRIQMLAGMRPQGVRLLRHCDIDRSDDIWVYLPSQHKTSHKDKNLVITFDYDCQKILQSYLMEYEDQPEVFLFSPAAAMNMISLDKMEKRKSKPTPSQIKRRANAKVNGRKYNPYYTKDVYINAVKAAAKRAGVPKWTPNQLRHTTATEIEGKLGIEAAQIFLGHASPETTKIYLDPNFKLKQEIEKAKENARKVYESRKNK